MGAARMGRLLLRWRPPAGVVHGGRDIPPDAVTPSGWVAPLGSVPSPGPTTATTATATAATTAAAPPTPPLPFHISRTASREMPVYLAFRNGRTRVLTQVRRVRGDAEAMRQDLSAICDGREVAVRPGRLEVVGNYRDAVKTWLTRLGF